MSLLNRYANFNNNINANINANIWFACTLNRKFCSEITWGTVKRKMSAVTGQQQNCVFDSKTEHSQHIIVTQWSWEGEDKTCTSINKYLYYRYLWSCDLI